MSTIVVGVSGTPHNHPAIAWAAAFAAPSHSSIQLVHVVDTTWGLPAPEYVEAARQEAEAALVSQVAAARAEHPEIDFSYRVSFGSPTSELVIISQDADYLVIGAHPTARHGNAGVRAVRLAGLAACSVIVVPATAAAVARGVVVGVDGSADSAVAVEFGAALAERHGERLTVVHAWDDPEPWGMIEPMFLPTEPDDDDRLLLAEAIAGLAGLYPDLEIVSEVISSPAVAALYTMSRGARMVVVGSRGRHGLTKALLGSVSEELVAELPCPVAVIRPAYATRAVPTR